MTKRKVSESVFKLQLGGNKKPGVPLHGRVTLKPVSDNYKKDFESLRHKEIISV